MEACEFRNGSYAHMVEDAGFSSYSSPELLRDSMKEETVMQSYLIFTTELDGETARFISQSFPCDPTTLKYYVMNQQLDLFVSVNHSKYFFEFRN